MVAEATAITELQKKALRKAASETPFLVYELKNEIPSFEEFMRSYEHDANLNYDDLNSGDISEVKGYGPCKNSSCDCYCSASECICNNYSDYGHGGHSKKSVKITEKTRIRGFQHLIHTVSVDSSLEAHSIRSSAGVNAGLGGVIASGGASYSLLRTDGPNRGDEARVLSGTIGGEAGVGPGGATLGYTLAADVVGIKAKGLLVALLLKTEFIRPPCRYCVSPKTKKKENSGESEKVIKKPKSPTEYPPGKNPAESEQFSRKNLLSKDNMNELEKLLIPEGSPKRKRKILTDPERIFAKCHTCQEPGNLDNMLRKPTPTKDLRGVEFEELDKLRERIEELKKKVKSNPNSLDKITDKINENLVEIFKYLEASEEIIQREATEHPKISNSVADLTKSITDLEDYLNDLEIKYQALEEKTKNAKIAYGVGGTIGGVVGAYKDLMPKQAKKHEILGGIKVTERKRAERLRKKQEKFGEKAELRGYKSYGKIQIKKTAIICPNCGKVETDLRKYFDEKGELIEKTW
ncbi:12556_t:CDS:2 [Funneliformis geosporum]|nr:12556_t:CDS:2 [Funneliformis geosporum]